MHGPLLTSDYASGPAGAAKLSQWQSPVAWRRRPRVNNDGKHILVLSARSFCTLGAVFLLVAAAIFGILNQLYYSRGYGYTQLSTPCGVTHANNIEAADNNSTKWWLSETTDDKEYANIPSTIFKPWDFNKHPFPCYPGADTWQHEIKLQRTRNDDGASGIFYVRNMKTASSTIAGVAARIAHRYGHLLEKGTKNGTREDRFCRVRFDHSSAAKLNYKGRDRDKSFLFTFVRDPARRAISQVFHFQVSREKMEPNDANIINLLQNGTALHSKRNFQNYQTIDLCLANCTANPRRVDVESILDGYDFVGVTEYMAESLVVLQMLLGLKTADIVHISAKQHGGYDGGGYKGKCYYIFPSFVSPGLKEYFASNKWKANNKGDELLHRAAIKSLHRTIVQLGVKEFETNLDMYHKSMALAQEQCKDETRFPCTAAGVKRAPAMRNCYFIDCGCGYPCLDRLADEGVI